MSIRRGVTHKRPKVWQNNKNKDMYTGWHKNKFENDDDIDPHVDHIVECQLGDLIWNNVLDGSSLRTTRGRSVRLDFNSTVLLVLGMTQHSKSACS